MEEIYSILAIVSIVISIIILVSFFKLCSNVNKISKSFENSDLLEYQFQKKMGNYKKAYYHLQRDFIFNFGKNGISLDIYYSHFKNLGEGIPEFKEFKNFSE